MMGACSETVDVNGVSLPLSALFGSTVTKRIVSNADPDMRCEISTTEYDLLLHSLEMN